jgi:hypothetical protein
MQALDHRVGEMRGAHDDERDLGGIDLGRRLHLAQGLHETLGDVGRRRDLDGRQNLAAGHDDRVRVSASDVDADPVHHAGIPAGPRGSRPFIGMLTGEGG